MTWEIVPDAPQQRAFPWWIPFSIGALLALVGLAFLVWPFFAATWAFAVLIGAAFVASGLGVLLRQRPGGSSAVGGILMFAIGLLAIIFSDFTVSVLITFVGMTLIAAGVLWLVIALGLSRGGFNPATLPAVLMLAAGIVAIVWPSAALLAAAVAFGLVLLGVGGLIAWGALRARGVVGGASRGRPHGTAAA